MTDAPEDHEEEELSRVESIQLVLDHGASVFQVCMGKPYCDRPPEDDGKDCVWCMVFSTEDGQTAQEIEAAIVQKQRGH
jgi:hypothetical protein